MLKSAAGTLKIILLIILFLNSALVFSGGRQEGSVNQLVEAEELINQREYNQAVLILSGMLKTNPDKLDEIQELLNRVRTEKELYNDRYEELLLTYGGDDVEAAYPIIKDLEELDPNPNEATRESLVLARETAGFVFNNNRYNDIMEEAAGYMTAGQLPQAVDTYMSGFDLSRDIFNDAGYGNIIMNDVYEHTNEMDELSREFLTIYTELNSSLGNETTVFDRRDLEAYPRTTAPILENLTRSIEIKRLLDELAAYYLEQEENIRISRGDEKQVHYLVYMNRLLKGRTDAQSPEGIAGAVNVKNAEVAETIRSHAVLLVEEAYTDALSHYSAGRYEQAGAGFSTVLTLAEGVVQTFAVWDTGYTSFSGEIPEPSEDEQLNTIISNQVNNETWYSAAESYTSLINENLAYQDLKQQINSLENPADGEQIRSVLVNHDRIITELGEQWEFEYQRLNTIASSGLNIGPSVEATGSMLNEINRMEDDLLADEIVLVAAMAEADLSDYEVTLLGLTGIKDEGILLIDGIPAEDQTAAADDTGENAEEIQILYKYPDRALESLLQIQPAITRLAADISGIQNFIADERIEIRTGEPVREALTHADSLDNSTSDLAAEVEQLIARAREQIFTADRLRQEGERRIQESKTLTQQAQFPAAKERLEQAAQKFDDSLTYQEDSALRDYRDNDIPRLYEEIQVAENNLVIRQVRQYLTEGKSYYSQGKFPSAQNVLIKAKNRWADTNVEENAEVEYWLTLTQTALSVTSGRTISQTDPLYSEMNQYLSQAKADFIKAKSLYDQGSRDDADFYFSRAEQSILYVQQFFPFNEEARVLNLRISQYRDPESFRELFNNDFQTARSLISTNPRKAYIDLKDLEAINATYPGLQSAITEAEYASGIKVKPPDTTKINRSIELYQLAYSIVSRNVRSEFNVALSYLDEAITLNPDNIEAIRLKDRISADVGGTATVVMSSADQQRYLEAVNEFSAGNYLKARIIVENLLRNPDNQRNTKILELKERIDRTR